MLLDYGADVKLKNRWVNTPLLRFVTHLRDISDPSMKTQFVAACKVLLESNSDVNIQMIKSKVYGGDTPLHFAVRIKNYDLANMILESFSS